jgi:oxygen-dependent protoporphyrinogen oxidase
VSYLWNELRYLIQPGINFELVRGWNRPEGVLDESLESFLTRRGHPLTARVLGSALAHGIYAADARLLSVRAAFPKLWELEEKGNGRILWGLLTRSREEKEAEKRKAEEERRGYELGDVPGLMEGVSVYSFRDGMHTLADALARAVAKKPNVRVLSGAEVTALKFAEDGDGFEVCLTPSLYILPCPF